MVTSIILGLGWCFLLLLFWKWVDMVLTLVTRHHRNMTRVSLPIHSLPRGVTFCLNTKKPDSIHRHKDSIWRDRRDVQELLLWLLFWKDPSAWLNTQLLAFQNPQKCPDPSRKYNEREKKKGYQRGDFFLYAKKASWCDGFYKVIGKGSLKRWGGW